MDTSYKRSSRQEVSTKYLLSNNKHSYNEGIKRWIIEDKMIDDFAEYSCKILSHSCTEGNNRCMRETPPGSGLYKCRVPTNPQCSKPKLVKKQFPSMPNETCLLLKDLGIEDQAYKFKWRYFSQNAQELHLPPLIPEIFTAIQSSCNMQIPDGSGNESAYLHSYLTGEDEKAVVDKCNRKLIKLSGDLNSAKSRKAVSDFNNDNAR